MKTKNMKNLIVWAMVALLIFGITSCGKDGKDGKPYIKLDWIGAGIQYFLSNIPGLPDPIIRDTYYKSQTGTYTFEYVHNDRPGVKWTGEITLEKGTDGKDGGLFSDGDDGDDIFYELDLFAYIGPSLYSYGTTKMKQADNPSASYKPFQQIVRDGWIITLKVTQQEVGK
jgi:hypothetical protein